MNGRVGGLSKHGSRYARATDFVLAKTRADFHMVMPLHVPSEEQSGAGVGD